MDIRQLKECIEHPELLNNDTLYGLKELLARYPYFQTAWVLYLKNLFLLKDPSFKEELARGAVFVADLSVLFYYIEGERFRIREYRTDELQGETPAADRTLDLINRFLADLPEPVSEELPLPDSVAVEDYTSVLLGGGEETSAEALPLKGQELIDSFIEKSGGDENTLPQEGGMTDESPEPAEEKTPGNEAPGIKSDEGEESYFTETLAKIYIRQQRYDKALEIIKKLNLKYPKKNTYFADQIRFIEKLIINAKSK